MKEDEKDIAVLGWVQDIFGLSPNLSPRRREALI
jgi:predicted 3-demethylubiquinone-9 3-methyltransferase (glyoxalase superfamily)